MQVIRADNVYRLVIASRDELASLDAEVLLAQMTTADQVVKVDLAAVPMIHSGDLATLVDLYKDLMKHGKDFVLTNVSADVRKVLAITRLDQVFSLV